VTTLLNGLLGGLFAGVLAAVVVRIVAGESSATAAVLARTVGPRRAASRWWVVAAWLSYGSLAGGALVALELFVLGLLGVPPSTAESLGVAVAWSALLFGLASAVLGVAFSLSFVRSRLDGLVGYHLGYGLGLGLWIRLTWIT
jgi:hypothetical protein